MAALSLAHEGLRVVVLERTAEALALPRAVMIDGETLRAFERLGLAEVVRAIVQPPREPHRVCFTNSKHEEIFGLDVPHAGLHGWCDVNYMDQPELEALLRKRIERDPRIEVRLGVDVTALDQDAEGVTLQTRRVASGESGAEADRVRAAWAIGCDGASSFVRRALGIEWKSLGYDQDWLVIDVVMNPGCRLPEKTMQVCDPERLATYVCVKDPQRPLGVPAAAARDARRDGAARGDRRAARAVGPARELRAEARRRLPVPRRDGCALARRTRVPRRRRGAPDPRPSSGRG